jgi:hypothetical protein
MEMSTEGDPAVIMLGIKRNGKNTAELGIGKIPTNAR